MHNFLSEMEHSQIVVDLGCGRGSFHYELYNCRIIGIDLSLEHAKKRPGISYVKAYSDHMPLASNSVDAVVCHHTLEHFDNYRQTLQEIDRILKEPGFVWIAVPNGYSFDDSLYRLVFSGGGHVNRFSRVSLVREVEALTRLRLVQSVDLFTGFTYLKKPSPEELVHFPRSARALFDIPPQFSAAGILGLNALTRIIDRIFGFRTSQYGWGFVFATQSVSLSPLHIPYFNVCSNCGSGNPAATLREKARLRAFLGVGFYQCAFCDQLNSFVEPPPGLA